MRGPAVRFFKILENFSKNFLRIFENFEKNLKSSAQKVEFGNFIQLES